MCTSQAEGGIRCAAHTRPRYQSAAFGTPEWDEAAAAYASTPTGRMELASSLAAAEAAEDIRSAVAFEHALREGQRLRERAEEVRTALDAAAVPSIMPEHPESADEAASTPLPVPDLPSPDKSPSVGHTDEQSWDDDEDESWADDWDEEAEWSRSGLASAERLYLSSTSPTMAGRVWDRTDPVFASCEPEMTQDAFIDQVCDNLGITRAEFEATAAAEAAAHPGDTRINLPGGLSLGAAPGAPVLVGMGPDGHPLMVERLSPAEIRRIALAARARRDTAEAAHVDDLMSAPTAPTPATTPNGSTSTATGSGEAQATNRARSAVRQMRLPDDPATLTRLAQSEDPEVREAVAAHPNTPATSLVDLTARNQPIPVRVAAARNPNLPSERLIELTADTSVKVRAGAARNPANSAERLNYLSEDPNAGVRGATARNPSTPAETYQRLVADPSTEVRKSAAIARHITPAAATALANDPDRAVRTALAGNRSLTDPTLMLQLRTDPAQGVRAAVGKHPITPSATQNILASDTAAGVRAAVAARRDATPQRLARMSRDEDHWVRRNVAWNHNTAPGTLNRLSEDTDPNIRAAVAGNPAAPAALQARLRTDTDPRVRVGLAKNPAASPELVAVLAQDSTPAVRAAAITNPNVRASALSRLTTDPDPWVASTARRRVLATPGDHAA